MADIVTTTPQAQPEHPIEQPGQNGFLTRHRLALGAITLISVFMNFYRLGQNGFGTFYPAAVRSMMDNWHNFFFASYDPGGFVTIDKPPVGFWFEVLSAKIFGFNSVSILLPEALAGVLAGLPLFYLVRRPLWRGGGPLAGPGPAAQPVHPPTHPAQTDDGTL